jgi:hypothetical protein
MALTCLPLAIGQTSTNAALASLIGLEVPVENLTSVPGITWCRLVKSSAAISAANANVVIYGSPAAGTVSAVSGAAAVNGTIAGVAILPSANVADATYFWVARRGPVTATTAGAVVAGAALATHGSAGALDDTTVTYDTRCGSALAAIGSATTGIVNMALP